MSEKKGRGYPPKQHRFKKGVSGNPAGRPRKAKEAAAATNDDELILKEAARMLSVGEDGEKLSAHQVVLRATLARAAKGDPRAQKLILERIEGAKRRRIEQVDDLIRGLIRRKDEGDFALADARAQGRPAPYLFPHPDNIYVDLNYNCVWLFGGTTPEAAAARAELQETAVALSQNIARLERRVKRHAEDGEAIKRLTQLRAAWAQMFGGVDLDPPVYVGHLPQDQVPPPPSRRLIAQLLRKHDAFRRRRDGLHKKSSVAEQT